MRQILTITACLLVVLIASVIFGLVTGFMPGIILVVILTALLTGAVNKRLDSGRIRKQLGRDGSE